MTEQAHPYGEAGGLVLELVTASMNANFNTMDTLYESERRRRMALEVHIGEVLDRFDFISGGTVREYESVIRSLELLPFGKAVDEFAARHHEQVQS